MVHMKAWYKRQTAYDMGAFMFWSTVIVMLWLVGWMINQVI